MVNAIRKQELVAKITVRTHELLSGLIAEYGGHDEGLNPHELIEGALAACTILTAQLYANRKNMKLESTDVEVKVESEGAQSAISRKVSFRGALSDDEKANLAMIVEKCPIHKLLESQIKITTTVV